MALLGASAAFPLPGNPSAEMILSKHYSGTEVTPMINEYVEYDLSIKNTSDVPIENESLWISFTSTGGRTNVSTSFSVQNLSPGDSKVLHLGPFKLREAGEHSLFMGMNTQAKSSLPNEISISHEPDRPFDTFTVYEPVPIQVTVAGIVSIVLGIGIILGIFYFKKKKERR